MARIAINGLGRIGRATLKVILDVPELEFVAANDIASLENIAYLLQHDTVYGRYERAVSTDGNQLVIDGVAYPYLSERDPEDLPWADLSIDIVIESTGFFTRREDAAKHIKAGAKFVAISAPTKSANTPMIVHGVNAGRGEHSIVSCASCTTNCIAPVVEVMGRRIGVAKAVMTTIHAYTSTQKLVDAPTRGDFRRGRAGAANLVPTSTGAAIATTKALPEFEGKFDGVAVRAPIPTGSIADITFVTERVTTVEEVNTVLTEESKSDRYGGVLGVTDEPIVSSDIVGDSRASIVDLSMTKVIDGDLVKVMTWYDNEWGFTNQMVRLVRDVAGTM